MRQFITIALLQFRLVLKSKGNLISMFAMPLLLTMIFGAMNTGGTTEGVRVFPIAVVDNDQSFVSAQLVEALKGEPTLNVRLVSEADMNQLFRDKKIEAGVQIQKEWQASLTTDQPLEVNLVAQPGSGNVQVAIRPALSRAVTQVTGDFAIARKLTGDDLTQARLTDAFAKVAEQRIEMAVSVATSEVQRETVAKKANVGETALGFTVMFVMMTVFSMSGVILSERQTGTWGRLLTSPTARLSIMGGYLLSLFVTGLFQFSVLVLISTLIWKANWGPLLPLYTMASAFILCATGLGLFLAGLVRTAEQVRIVGSVVVMATSMLGGVFWPLEFVGETMRRIAYFTPQAWAMDGFREVMLRGGAWGALSLPLLVLLSLTAVFMSAGLIRIRFE